MAAEKEKRQSSPPLQGCEEEKDMVQVFMVVRCYSCETFQVHQVKKINKWQCKVCNEKQSVIKTYGKGTARDCRMHVQKLNMARGEQERAMFSDRWQPEEGEEGVAGRERSVERAEGEGRQVLRGSHPPCDYASTFTTHADGKENPSVHPMVLAAGKSKWTTFIRPPKDEDDEEEDGVYTTDRNEFAQAARSRQKARRSLSERKPNPPFASRDPTTADVCPYSSVNQEFFHSPTSRRRTSNSDRYSKLQDPPTYCSPEEQERQTGRGHSHSMTNLSSFSSSGSSPAHHKEWIAQIKQDLEQFSADHHPAEDVTNTGHSGSRPPSGTRGRSETIPQTGSNDKSGTRAISQTGNTDKGIPKISSRWSQFMCEEDSESEEEGESSLLSSGPLQDSPQQSVHILASKSTISKFTLVQNL